MILQLMNHLWEHKIAYLIPTLVSGAMLSLAGTAWLDNRIDVRVTAQMHGLSEQVNRIERRQLEQSIRDAATLLCAQPGQRELINRMESLQADYESLTGRRYPVPSCELLNGEHR